MDEKKKQLVRIAIDYMYKHAFRGEEALVRNTKNDWVEKAFVRGFVAATELFNENFQDNDEEEGRYGKN